MKAPDFIQGVGLALVLSLAGGALFSLFTQVADTSASIRLVITLVAAAYAVFLLQSSTARVGKVTALLAFGAISSFSWIIQPDLLLYLLIHMGLLWLVRCLFFYRSLLAALMDIGLQGLSLAAAIWAMQETGSLSLCLWSFFLVQALFVTIPPRGLRPLPAATDGIAQEPGFHKAHRSAEAALRRLY